MNAVIFAACIFVVVFAGGSAGLLAQKYLPEKYTTGGARDMVGAVVGLLTLLSALVLGLLIWTAYGVYSGQKIAVQNLAVTILQLDMAFADYGPETAPAREQLRRQVATSFDQIWGGGEQKLDVVTAGFNGAVGIMGKGVDSLGGFHPSTDAQKQALAKAQQLLASIGLQRLQMAFALTDPVSYPLVSIVVGWAFFLFFGYGLLSKHSAMSFFSGSVGALAIASAIFLIMDLSTPYSGAFKVSSAPIGQVLGYLNKQP